MKSATYAVLAATVTVFLSRALFLPPALEDIDSVNFALALERFDPRLHQPHPPGYPVFVALARLVHFAVPDPARAISLLSALAQALLVVPLFALLSRLSSTRAEAAAATALTLVSPLVWFNGARPMSDSVGLLFIVTTQALLLRGFEAPKSFALGSLLAGVSTGVRFQAGLLTLPVWLYGLSKIRRGRGAAVLLLIGGVLAWAIPLALLSGGMDAYLRAFGETLDDALPAEPLIARPTLNRALKALYQALVSPWASPALGLPLVLLSAAGFVLLSVKRREALGLGFLCFVPYFLLHVLLQQVSVERYGLPYVPFLSWLAVSALSKKSFQWTGAASVALVSSVLTLPALAEYHETPSPPYAALDAVQREARPPEDFVLSGHFMFHRYFSSRPARIEFLPPAPHREVEALRTFWLDGGRKEVLFLAHPDRTDLETIAPSARGLVNRWEYGPTVRRFLSGARPIRAELVRIERPVWFSGPGFMISDEAGSIAEVTAVRERKAYLLPLSAPSFLLLSGEPFQKDASTARVEYGATRLDEVNLGSAVLKGYSLPSTHEALGSYDELRITTSAAAPFLFKGLDYGPETAAGFVHGEGWFLPERDEELKPFRWTSPKARSLLHVPLPGAHLVVEGVAPLHYFEPGLTVAIRVGDDIRATATPSETAFKIEVDMEPGFADVRVEASRSFVPDRIQHNGDGRALSLRVYRFELQPRERAR